MKSTRGVDSGIASGADDGTVQNKKPTACKPTHKPRKTSQTPPSGSGTKKQKTLDIQGIKSIKGDDDTNRFQQLRDTCNDKKKPRKTLQSATSAKQKTSDKVVMKSLKGKDTRSKALTADTSDGNNENDLDSDDTFKKTPTRKAITAKPRKITTSYDTASGSQKRKTSNKVTSLGGNDSVSKERKTVDDKYEDDGAASGLNHRAPKKTRTPKATSTPLKTSEGSAISVTANTEEAPQSGAEESSTAASSAGSHVIVHPQRFSDVDSDADTVHLDHGTQIKYKGKSCGSAENQSLDDSQLDADLNLVVATMQNNSSDSSDAVESDEGRTENKLTKVNKRLRRENNLLRALNFRLQRRIIINSEQVEATISNVDLESRQGLKQRICAGEDLSVGFENKMTGMMHAAFGYWIKAADYHTLRLKPSMTASRFIGNIARFIFTDGVLKQSSVTGKISNAHRFKNGQRVAAKPALEAKGLDAVAAITRHWLTLKETPEHEILRVLTTVPTVIAKKIHDIGREQKRKKHRKRADAEQADDDRISSALHPGDVTQDHPAEENDDGEESESDDTHDHSAEENDDDEESESDDNSGINENDNCSADPDENAQVDENVADTIVECSEIGVIQEDGSMIIIPELCADNKTDDREENNKRVKADSSMEEDLQLNKSSRDTKKVKLDDNNDT